MVVKAVLFVLIAKDSYAFNPRGRAVNKPRCSNSLKWMSTESDMELNKRELNPEVLEKDLIKQQEEFRSLMQKSFVSKEKDIESANYGFISRSEWRQHSQSPQPLERPYDDGNLSFHKAPPNFVRLASQQFGYNLDTMLGKYEEDRAVDDAGVALQEKLATLTINSNVAADLDDISGVLGVMKEALVVRAPYHMVCPLFEWGTHMPHRFYIMEIVGRAPYLSFLSMLNMYEACGLWRPTEDVRVSHVLQELSKFHRIRIMEELGGDQPWVIRAVASHAALFVQVTCAALWLISPSLSYRFALMLESYAFHTYDIFLEENKEALRGMPAPPAATKKMVTGGGLDASKTPSSLYDVFCSIRGDSAYHAMTLRGSYDPQVALHAPSIEKKFFVGAALALFISSMFPHPLHDGTYFSLLDNLLEWV